MGNTDFYMKDGTDSSWLAIRYMGPDSERIGYVRANEKYIQPE